MPGVPVKILNHFWKENLFPQFLVVHQTDTLNALSEFNLPYVIVIVNITKCDFLPPANEVWGKVIFLHLSVILFKGGSTFEGTPGTRYTTHLRKQCMLGDTGNKRAVRILLECILVY